MLRKAFDAMMRLSPLARRLRSQYWHRYVAMTIKDAPVAFLNYGYAGLLPENPRLDLLPEDEPDRLFIRLYHHVASAVDLAGREVVEVGCGRGGGASYIRRYLKPRVVVGVDLTERNLLFCAVRHRAEGLFFLRGDAESLPFADGAFDALVNVESSHCYGDMNRFLSEVVRVVRPRGYFLFADFRFAADAPALREQIVQCGLEIEREVDITPFVLRAMEQDTERRFHLIRQYMPPLLHKISGESAGLKGSGVYRALDSGRMTYLSFVLQRKTI